MKRNHNARYERFECGEGPTCEWIDTVLSIGGSLLGGLLGKESAESYNEATQQRALEAAAPQMWGPVQPYVEGALADAQSLYGLGGFAPQANPLSLLGLENYLGYAEGMLPEMVGASQASWLNALDPSISPYTWDYIRQGQGELNEQFLEGTLPYLESTANATGGYGGRSALAQGAAAEGLAEAQQAFAADALNAAYANELQAQTAALGMAGEQLGLGFMPSQAQMWVGDQYQQQALAPAENLTGYTNIINPYTGLSSGAAAGEYYDPWSSAAAGAGVGGDIFSEYGNVFGNIFNSEPEYDPRNPTSGYEFGGWVY